MSLALGQAVTYKDKYDASLLYPIARSLGRGAIGVTDPIFYGVDIWNCYEVSWLNESGKPEVRLVEFQVPSSSPNIIESKSLKLYLNSFNNTNFTKDADVLKILSKDLSEVCGAPIKILMTNLREISGQYKKMNGICIDDIDVECSNYTVDPSLLRLDETKEHVTETLYSELLKSNCLVTGQPDWASLQISYQGPKIDHASLLQYVVSFRNHNEFHEQCVERIYMDIMMHLEPMHLEVYARFTRRGGIDINPFRSSSKVFDVENIRSPRQ
ncbi:MAG: NADPH-dependent 7-cyano-7-deazaguanine reductase QueF [Pseudomonadota bacterium]